MLFERQKRLLTLLEILGGEVASLEFQKLLFLYCQEEETPTYEFVPYKYGGFSFTSYADKRRLIERGLLADEERTWKLTPAGRKAFSMAPSIRARMLQFSRLHSRLRGDVLVAEAYRRHPFYAIRSEMASRVLAGDSAALAAIAAARPGSKPGLFTIGYEGRSLENYLNQLLKSGITLLCDVRRNALSRKYGFAKSTLSRGCEGVGIRYEHLPELGISSDLRQGLKTEADYAALFGRYRRHSLPGQFLVLLRIRDWILAGACVALTCYERLPSQCHRHCVADALKSEFGQVFVPRHL